MSDFIKKVRRANPCIHCITNYVTANDVANILLACGAGPVMSDEPEEAAEMTSLSSGLYLNIGTLNDKSIKAMFLASERAVELKHPVVLDPVGAGATVLRTKTALKIIDEFNPTVVRGNISEINALIKSSEPDFADEITAGTTRGVDASSSDIVTEENLLQTVNSVAGFALRKKTVVCATGQTDIITDGKTCFTVRNGRPEMEKVTGTGCQLSAMITAFVCANPGDALDSTMWAVCAMGLAGEIALSRMNGTDGNCAYRNKIIDSIFNMTDSDVLKGAEYEIIKL